MLLNIALSVIVVMAGRSAESEKSAYATKLELRKGIASYRESPTEAGRDSCNRMIKELMESTSPPDIRRFYLLARASEILGDDRQFVDILNDAVRRFGDQKPPYAGVVDLTVKAEANMWMGRHFQNAGRAEDTVKYYTAAENAFTGKIEALGKIICRCRISEIQAVMMNDKDGAVKSCEIAESILNRISEDPRRPFLQALVKNHKESALNGISNTVCPPDDALIMFAAFSACLDNSAFEVGDDFSLMKYRALRISEEKGRYNKQVLMLTEGYDASHGGDYSTAEKTLAPLFESSGFLAPAAGLQLAVNARKDKAAALAILDKIAARWPDTAWPQYCRRTKARLGLLTVTAAGSAQRKTPADADAAPEEPETDNMPAAAGMPDRKSDAVTWLLTAFISGSITFGAVLFIHKILRKKKTYGM